MLWLSLNREDFLRIKKCYFKWDGGELYWLNLVVNKF